MNNSNCHSKEENIKKVSENAEKLLDYTKAAIDRDLINSKDEEEVMVVMFSYVTYVDKLFNLLIGNLCEEKRIIICEHFLQKIKWILDHDERIR